jgi:hypothetical protein
MSTRQRHFPRTVAPDSALAQLGKHLTVRPAIGQPQEGPDVLPMILRALQLDGWEAPRASQAEGGRISGERRRFLRMIRRAAVNAIMSNAPENYRARPRSDTTIAWVHQELGGLSSVFGKTFSQSAIEQDLKDWARHHPEMRPLQRVARKQGSRKKTA